MNATLTTMQLHADNYLSERRRLGFSLRSTGYAVKSFARYIDDLGHKVPVTVAVMADWARRDKGNSDKPAATRNSVDASASPLTSCTSRFESIATLEITQRKPSSPLISLTCKPPMRGSGRPEAVTATATTISFARGASDTRASIASK